MNHTVRVEIPSLVRSIDPDYEVERCFRSERTHLLRVRSRGISPRGLTKIKLQGEMLLTDVSTCSFRFNLHNILHSTTTSASMHLLIPIAYITDKQAYYLMISLDDEMIRACLSSRGQ